MWNWENLEELSSIIEYENKNINGKEVLIGYFEDPDQWIDEGLMRRLFFEILLEIEGFMQTIGYELMFYEAFSSRIPAEKIATIHDVMDNPELRENNPLIKEHLFFFFKKFMREFSFNPISRISQYIQKFKHNNKKWIEEKIESYKKKHKVEIQKNDIEFCIKFRNELAHPKHVDIGETVLSWNFTDIQFQEYVQRVCRLHNFLRLTAHTIPIVK